MMEYEEYAILVNHVWLKRSLDFHAYVRIRHHRAYSHADLITLLLWSQSIGGAQNIFIAPRSWASMMRTCLDMFTHTLTS